MDVGEKLGVDALEDVSLFQLIVVLAVLAMILWPIAGVLIV